MLETTTEISLSTILDTLNPVDGVAPFTPPASWMQGRTTYGGLAAAAMMRVGRSVVEPGRRAQAMLTTFPGPVLGQEATIQARVLRAGKSLTQVAVEIVQDATVKATALQVFGCARPTRLEVPAATRPDVPAWNPDKAMPFVPEIMPTFLKNIQMSWVVGLPPMSGVPAGSDLKQAGYCRLRQTTQEPARAEEMLALCDIWPAPTLQLLQSPAPASSVSWAMEFLQDQSAFPASEPWLYTSDIDAAAGGMTHGHARLYAPDGSLAAVSRQMYAVFDQR